MKVKYKHIYFQRIGIGDEWYCRHNKSNSILGRIGWHKPWKQYCVIPEQYTIFNNSCLDDISDFLGQLNNLPKEASDEKLD